MAEKAYHVTASATPHSVSCNKAVLMYKHDGKSLGRQDKHYEILCLPVKGKGKA